MTKLVAKTYRVASRATRAAGLAVVALILMGLVMGCSGFADQARSDNGPSADATETAQRLYESIEVVFRRETEGIDIALEERLMVISHYEELDEDRRRRFVGQVVPIGRGAMGVRIRAEYQNEVVDEEGDGEFIWSDEPRAEVEEEAAPDELRLARMVERVFHSGE